MTYKFDGYNYLLRLEKGERLVSSLTAFANEQHVNGAWLSGIGAAAWAELGYYDLQTQQYHWQKIDKLMEITSLQGNLAWSGDQPAVHLHGSFSDDAMQAFGGHVKELEVGGACELFMHLWNAEDRLSRSPDQLTGLKLLDV